MSARSIGIVVPLAALGFAFACGDDDGGGVAPDAGTESGGAINDGSRAPPPAAPPPDGASASALSPSFVHRDVNHVLSTGQSLSVGAKGSPPLSTVQPYQNTMFVTGVIAGAVGLAPLVPLVEGTSRSVPAAIETMSSGLANLVTKMAREELLIGQPAGRTSHDLLVSVHGVGGQPYSELKKGTQPYATGMAQAKAGFDLATAAGKSYVVRVVTNVHGEADHKANNAGYAQDLARWQADYEADVKALTGQGDPVPMLETQMSSWTRQGDATSLIPGAQLAASVASGGKVVLVGPKYHLPYSDDGVHLTNEGYRHMGEDYAKVYRRVILEGKPWEPVRPLAVARTGAVIQIKFAVPAPPLVLDETTVTNPGNYGFEFAQAGGPPGPTITGVALSGPDTVTVTLSAEPAGQSRRIRYAFTGVPGALGGPTSGPRGNLRDSDTTRSRNGYVLYDWCVHFDEAVP